MIWRAIAWLLARPAVADWLVWRAMRTPYSNITSADGQDVYMARWWLFNPYMADADGPRRFGWCPLSIRVHHIRRADQDRHLHDHAWNARTVILRGYYIEEREDGSVERRSTGSTATLKFGEYHRIAFVPEQGATTLFMLWRYRGIWGFKVDGRKVPWRDYVAGKR